MVVYDFEISNVLSQFDLGRNKVAEDFYILTIESIRDDERLWFDFSIELSHSYLELKKWDMLNPLIEQLHDACKKDGVDDTSKADLLIQIYAVKIEQMFATGNTEQLESIYHLTKRLSANVGDHRSAPILAEFNGSKFDIQNIITLGFFLRISRRAKGFPKIVKTCVPFFTKKIAFLMLIFQFLI